MTAVNLILADSTTRIITQRVVSSWAWYIIRAAGFVSAALLIGLMLSGIGQVTGLTYRFLEPVKAWALHKAMAFALVAALILHIGFLLLDHYVPFNVFQVTIPFLSHVNNGSSLLGMALGGLAVSFGIFAMYGVVLLVASSLSLIDSHKHTWRWLHYSSYAVVVLVFLHALYSGSDLKYGTFRAGFIFLFGIVLLGILSRIRRSGSLKDHDDSD